MRFYDYDDGEDSVPIPPTLPKRGIVTGARCAECPFSANGQPNRPVVGEGVENPDWLIVGEGPGQNEVALGRPFVGASGMLVNKALGKIGVPRDRLYITNATLCLPTPGANESAKRKARECCAPRFAQELAEFPAKPVLALGAIAAQAFLGDETTIGAVAGSYHEARIAGAELRALERVAQVKKQTLNAKFDALQDKNDQLQQLLNSHHEQVADNPTGHENCDKPKGKGRCSTIKAAGRVQLSIERLNKDIVVLDEEVQTLIAEGAQMRLDLDASEPLRVVIPSTHPAAILRGGAGVAGAHAPDLAFFNLIYDIGKVAAIAAGKDIRFREDIETEYESSPRAELLIEKILWAARAARFLAVDTETYVVDEKRHNALQPLNAKIRAIGLATIEFGISVAWRVLTDRARRLIAALLADPSILKVMHNKLYDCPVLDHNAMPVRGPVDDTLLLHHCAFPGLTHRLQQVTTQFFAMPPWKAEFRAGDDTLPDLTRYNALDTLSTARIHGPLIIAVKKMGTERAYEMDLKMARVAEKMHVVGVPVSREVNQQLYDQFAAHMVTARKTIEDKANDPAILAKLWERLAFEQAKRTRKGDPESFDERIAKRLDLIRQAHADGKWKWTVTASDHVVAYLKARGVPMYAQTDKGKTACSKDILENFSHLPEVRALLDYRENQKLLSTFVYRMFDRQKGNETVYGYADESDRIHPRWNVHRITSRWSAEDPQAQNWPKADKKKGRPNLRSQVVAPAGRVFVGFDFAQLEARIIALLSGDPFLVGIFDRGLDIHIEFARVVWPDFDARPIEERKKLRDQIKRPEYGSFYGGQAETLHKNLAKDYPDIKLADIARMMTLMTTKMGGVTTWHQDLLRSVAMPPHELRSLLYNRCRNFPLGNADVNDTYNWPVQTCGAEIMNTGVDRMEGRVGKYRDCWAILQIHDAAVYECNEDDADKVKADVVDCFTQELFNSEKGVTIKFPVDVKVSKSWAEV